SLGAEDRVVVGTKVRLGPADRADAPAAVARALDESLERLGRDRVDLLQLHDAVGGEAGLPPEAVVAEVFPALEEQRLAGKVRFLGFTGNGDPRAVRAVAEAGVADTVQVFFNLLNPTAAYSVPAGYPAVPFRGLIAAAASQDM